MGDTKEMRSRTFEVVQYEINRKTGQEIFSEQNILFGLAHQTIEKWAYVLHDQDDYTEEEETAWLKRLAETDAAREQAQYVSRYDADFAREQITFCYAALA